MAKKKLRAGAGEPVDPDVQLPYFTIKVGPGKLQNAVRNAHARPTPASPRSFLGHVIAKLWLVRPYRSTEGFPHDVSKPPRALEAVDPLSRQVKQRIWKFRILLEGKGSDLL